MLLRVEKVTKSFDGFVAVQDVELTVAQGQMACRRRSRRNLDHLLDAVYRHRPGRIEGTDLSAIDRSPLD